MGWTGYHATHYNNKGQVDRKAECDAYFEEGLNRGFYKVVKSAMRGSVYYAAVKPLKKSNGKDEQGNVVYAAIPEQEQRVFAVVFLTRVDNKDYYNFYYKDMDESMCPCEYDCPKSILNLLDETENEYSNEWRNLCREKAEKSKNALSLANLPLGSVIRFVLNGKSYEVVKHGAAFQFKRPFWYNADAGTYIPKTRIPSNFEVIRVGA